MTPKEKAIDLVNRFSLVNAKKYVEDGITHIDFALTDGDAKQCALIAVDEIIKSNPTNPLTGGYIELYSDMVDEAIVFWQQVKSEIEKL